MVVWGFEIGDRHLRFRRFCIKIIIKGIQKSEITDCDTGGCGMWVQKLNVPQDYTTLMQNYRQRFADFQEVESDFFNALNQIDKTVYTMFNITDREKDHIENRLGSFPLNKLQPRYPWQTVRPRSIKAYTEDRFA
jgi:mevalonate kinase